MIPPQLPKPTGSSKRVSTRRGETHPRKRDNVLRCVAERESRRWVGVRSMGRKRRQVATGRDIPGNAPWPCLCPRRAGAIRG